MTILNNICNGCAFLMCCGTFIAFFAMFCTCVYSCFTKKIEGKLFVKILLSVISGCICPWIIKLTVYFYCRIGA